MTIADPKPRRRIIDIRAGREKVRAEGCCRLCGAPYGLTRHHLVPKGAPHFGDDLADNIIPVCGTGTTGCHGLLEHTDRTAGLTLLARITDLERAYADDRAYTGWLEDHYTGRHWHNERSTE